MFLIATYYKIKGLTGSEFYRRVDETSRGA
jgi:hypothetical protein